jgi:hypothetical protein
MNRPHLIAAFVLGTMATLSSAAPNTPTADFIDNGNGTVTHRKTGLSWMRCAKGQVWTGTDCTGAAQTFTWSAARTLSDTYAGASDWRLPTIAELHSIVETEDYNINPTLFPGTPVDISFWSATATAGVTTAGVSAWSYHFGYGYGNGNSYTGDSYAVRLVRSSSAVDYAAPTTPSSAFTDHGDGTVTHNRTGLTWKRCAEGQTWTGTTCSGDTATYVWSAASTLTSGMAGHTDWRLPNWGEFESIIEYQATEPAINASIFPATALGRFWTATTNARFLTYAWHFNSGDGSSYYSDKQYSGYVRLVRGGSTSTSISDSDRIFNWAETHYASYLSPPTTTAAQAFDGYTYRYYSGTNSYLATKSGHLWYLGAASAQQILDLGAIGGWLSQAVAGGY